MGSVCDLMTFSSGYGVVSESLWDYSPREKAFKFKLPNCVLVPSES